MIHVRGDDDLHGALQWGWEEAFGLCIYLEDKGKGVSDGLHIVGTRKRKIKAGFKIESSLNDFSCLPSFLPPFIHPPPFFLCI